MANVYGTNNADYLDMIKYGVSNDYVQGYDGNDTILGWSGNDTLDGWNGNDVLYGESGNDLLMGYNGTDTLYGGSGNDQLYGESGYDKLYGGDGDDTLSGGDTFDDLYGGMGKDQMTGGAGADWFFFETKDSGDIYANQADTITDFKDEDQIWLKGSYSYAGSTSAPADGQYSIWQKDGNYVVTWNAANDTGYHDLIVKGDNPMGDISFY